jgi:predicted nucleic acid-binding Zn ribbon protein
MGLAPVGVILDQLERSPAWDQCRQWRELVRLWGEVVGATVQRQTEPIHIRRNVLYVATRSPVWAQNLAFERHRLLQRLNSHLSQPLQDIRFRPTLKPEGHPPAGRVFRGEIRPQGADPAPTPTYRRPPICSRCHVPAPLVELDRWGVCSLCRARELRQ